MRYLSRRLAHGLLVLAGVSVLSFVFTALAPGDFLNEMRLDPQISGETVTALRDRLRAGSTASAEIPALASIGAARRAGVLVCV